MAEAAAPRSAFRHAAAFYGSAGEYVAQVRGFIADGLSDGDPVFVAVPATGIELIRNALNGVGSQLTFADMTEMGANPAWIIPRVQAFVDAHPGRAVRYVGEPIWETRSTAELIEATRHEALINLAFAGLPVSILCPYNIAALDPAILGLAEQTHPELVRKGRSAPSPAYGGSAQLPAGCDDPLPEPPQGAATLAYRRSPAAVRAFVRARALAAGLAPSRVTDLVIAVGELAANTLAHTGQDGIATFWASAGEVICQVQDTGQIRDRLVGRRCPEPDAGSGHGLWVVHQLCDLVELRTGESGTVIRLHMRLAD